MKTELSAFFDCVRPAIEATLDGLLPAESSSPVQIHKAMRYSTLGGGKRIRSSLCVAAFAAYKENWRPILPVAAAVELIHAYSLIHDDLPAMDDDDFRRGKPSCHKQFNEAIAILAGDALLTLAFEVLARSSDFPADRMLEVISMLGRAAGTRSGMIAKNGALGNSAANAAAFQVSSSGEPRSMIAASTRTRRKIASSSSDDRVEMIFHLRRGNAPRTRARALSR